MQAQNPDYATFYWKPGLLGLVVWVFVWLFLFFKAAKYIQHIALRDIYKANTNCTTMNTFPKANKPENSQKRNCNSLIKD